MESTFIIAWKSRIPRNDARAENEEDAPEIAGDLPIEPEALEAEVVLI